MSRILVAVIVFVTLFVGCKSASREQIDNGLYAAERVGKLAKDLGSEATVTVRVVPQGRAGMYGPGVEIDSRTELNATLTIVPSRSSGEIEPVVPKGTSDEESPNNNPDNVSSSQPANGDL